MQQRRRSRRSGARRGGTLAAGCDIAHRAEKAAQDGREDREDWPDQGPAQKMGIRRPRLLVAKRRKILQRGLNRPAGEPSYDVDDERPRHDAANRAALVSLVREVEGDHDRCHEENSPVGREADEKRRQSARRPGPGGRSL